jgi:predicted SprT family Zn-dependent metalloprotease
MHPQEARDLAIRLLEEHGLTALGWRFLFDNARRRFGSCRYGSKRITLSRPLTLLNDIGEVRDTLLHEIAHALSPGDGHGRRWRAKCVQIGARPKRCFDDTTVVAPPRAAAKYQFGCNACEWWVDRRRLTISRYICKKCRGELLYREKGSQQLIRVRKRSRV